MFEKEFLTPLRESIKMTRLRYLAVQNKNEEDKKSKGGFVKKSNYKVL